MQKQKSNRLNEINRQINSLSAKPGNRTAPSFLKAIKLLFSTRLKILYNSAAAGKNTKREIQGIVLASLLVFILTAMVEHLSRVYNMAAFFGGYTGIIFASAFIMLLGAFIAGQLIMALVAKRLNEGLFILGALFCAAVYGMFLKLCGNLLSPEIKMIGLPLTGKILEMVLLTFFAMLLMSNIITAVSSMYLATDLPLLLATPVSVNAVMLYKFIETMVNSSWMVLVFGLPIFMAYGRASHASFSYYLVFPLYLLPFFILATGISVFITVSLARIISARKLRNIFLVISLLFGAILIITIRAMQPERIFSFGINAAKQEQWDALLNRYLSTLSLPMSQWFPSTWLARSIMSALHGASGSTGRPYLLMLFTGAVLSMTGSLAVARFFYLGGYSATQTSGAGWTVRREKPVYRIVRWLTSWTRPATGALIERDIRLFWRETIQWTQFLMLAAVVILYLLNLESLPLDGGNPFFAANAQRLKNLISFVNIGMCGFVMAAVAARFVFPSVSLEGRAMWCVATAPVNWRDYLAVKFMSGFIPLGLLSLVLIILSNHILDSSPFIRILSTAAVFVTSAGIASMAVGMGAIYPKFHFENPSQVAASQGGIYFMILSSSYALANMMLLARPVYNFFSGQINISSFRQPYIWVSITGFVILNGSAMTIPFILALRRLRMGIDENHGGL